MWVSADHRLILGGLSEARPKEGQKARFWQGGKWHYGRVKFFGEDNGLWGVEWGNNFTVKSEWGAQEFYNAPLPTQELDAGT